MKSLRTTHTLKQRQRGAAFMVMLVIMIIGVAALFVASLNSSAIQVARNQTTADALAKAKEALIGYAVSDASRPGELPCPDVNDDGKLTMNVDYIGSNCVNPIGRLPWITLGLPELRDGAGEHLWYTVSKTFWSNGGAPINSNIPGNLTVNGTTAANNVIAIVFAAGPPLSGQSRSPTNLTACSTQNGTVTAESLCATNYLEGTNPALSLQAAPNLNYQSANSSSTFNDQMTLITPGNLFPVVEKRVARELNVTFANYITTHPGEYPNPANITCSTSANCISDTTQCRGWIPAVANNPPDWILPSWFTPNGWYRVIYYSAGSIRLNSSPSGCNLTVSGTPAQALFFMPGSPLNVQTRPSINLTDYLEDVENSNNSNDLYVQPGSTAVSNDSLNILP